MIPLTKFENLIRTYREQINFDLNELEAAAHLIGCRPNCFLMDEIGMFHIQASGKLEDCIPVLEEFLEKAKRIQQQVKGENGRTGN